MEGNVVALQHIGIIPSKFDREGALYESSTVAIALAPSIIDGTFEKKRDIRMCKELEKASGTIEKHAEILAKAVDKNDAKMKLLSESMKQASQLTRKACNEVSMAVKKMDDSINLDKMERIAVTMERIAVSMTTLADLEKDGKLDRIIKAVR